MKPPETITTERLQLRPPLLGDVPAMFERYCQDPAVTRFLRWQPHTSIAETEQFVMQCMQQWEDGSSFHWLIFPRTDEKLLGNIELAVGAFQATLGYVLARDTWGRGYMTEAVTALVSWTMAQPEIWRVCAWCDVENIASCRVLEKAGLQREGLLRRSVIHPNITSTPRDSYVYARVK